MGQGIHKKTLSIKGAVCVKLYPCICAQGRHEGRSREGPRGLAGLARVKVTSVFSLELSALFEFFAMSMYYS